MALLVNAEDHETQGKQTRSKPVISSNGVMMSRNRNKLGFILIYTTDTAILQTPVSTATSRT